MNKKIAEEIDNLEAKNLKYWSSYYAKEAEKIETFLKQFGFEKNDLLLSPKCSKIFNTIINSAQHFKLDNTNQTSFMAALSDFLNKKVEKEMLAFSLVNENNKLNDKLINLNIFQEGLIKDLNALRNELPEERQKLQDIESNIEFMRNKIDKYRVQIEKFQSYNEAIDKSIMHEKIVTDYQNLNSLKEQLKEVSSKLDIYQDLPPNMNLAQIKIQTLQNELNTMDQEIDKIVNNGIML